MTSATTQVKASFTKLNEKHVPNGAQNDVANGERYFFVHSTAEGQPEWNWVCWGRWVGWKWGRVWLEDTGEGMVLGWGEVKEVGDDGKGGGGRTPASTIKNN